MYATNNLSYDPSINLITHLSFAACNCFVNGTVWPPGVDPTKDLLPCDENGQCQCRDDVIGKNCSSCPPTYWNVASGNGCEKCRCNSIGSVDEFCDLNSGQCNCKQGVAGRQCNLCAAGHYQFSKNGCKGLFSNQNLNFTNKEQKAKS